MSQFKLSLSICVDLAMFYAAGLKQIDFTEELETLGCR